jgi:hypothetical protein
MPGTRRRLVEPPGSVIRRLDPRESWYDPKTLVPCRRLADDLHAALASTQPGRRAKSRGAQWWCPFSAPPNDNRSFAYCCRPIRGSEIRFLCGLPKAALRVATRRQRGFKVIHVQLVKIVLKLSIPYTLGRHGRRTCCPERKAYAARRHPKGLAPNHVRSCFERDWFPEQGGQERSSKSDWTCASNRAVLRVRARHEALLPRRPGPLRGRAGDSGGCPSTRRTSWQSLQIPS